LGIGVNMKVDFEVVEVYYNNRYMPFTKERTDETTQVHYAIKINDDYFLIGQKNLGVHLCDME
jgi:hypothetical protein